VLIINREYIETYWIKQIGKNW